VPRDEARQPMARADRADAASWAECVNLLLGPILVASDRERRRENALHLAAAALRAADQPELAQQVEAQRA
jgi:hypothetical protein